MIKIPSGSKLVALKPTVTRGVTMRQAMRIVGSIWLVLSGGLVVLGSLALWGWAVYTAYEWAGVLLAFVTFWVAGTLAFGIVFLIFLPIGAIGAVLMQLGEPASQSETDSNEQ